MIRIEQGPRYLRTIRGLTAADRSRVQHALLVLQEAFGQPHLHAGIGIQRLRKNLFECRAGLELRILFFAEKGTLQIYDVMSHAQVRALLRSF